VAGVWWTPEDGPLMPCHTHLLGVPSLSPRESRTDGPRQGPVIERLRGTLLIVEPEVGPRSDTGSGARL